MDDSKRRARRKCAVLIGTGLILPGLMVGCGAGGGKPWWRIDNCATIPRGAVPPPAGTLTDGILKGQADRAEVEDFVVYKHEWYLGGTEPGPAGRRHLSQILSRLPTVPFPVVVQPVEPEEMKETSPKAAAELNEARRRAVVEYMASHGAADADQRVVLAHSTAEGLYGTTAAEIGQQYLIGQGGGGENGNFNGGGGFGGGGFGGGGFGGMGLGGFY